MATYSSTASGDGPSAAGSPAGLAGGSVDSTQIVVAYADSTVTRVAAPTTPTRTATELSPGSMTTVSVGGLDGDSVAPSQSVTAYTGVVVTRVPSPTSVTRNGAERSGPATIAATVVGIEGDAVASTQSVISFESRTVIRVEAPASAVRAAAIWNADEVSKVDVVELIGDLVSPKQSTVPFSSSLGSGAVIPTSYFRKVEGRVLDVATGEAITNGIYIAALDNFAVVGNVSESGAFIIYLLKQTYTQFILVADAGENESTDAEFDYVWYESEGNPSVGTSDEYVELAFDTAVPETGRPLPTGLNIAGDLTFK